MIPPDLAATFLLVVAAIVAAAIALMMGERGSEEWLRHLREKKRDRDRRK